MSDPHRVKSSTYMNWAKTYSHAKFNLATSGLDDLNLADLNVSLDDLKLTGGGYGYAPLQHEIATRYRVAPETIVTAAGTSFANHLAMASILNAGDEVLIEQPAYDPILSVAHYLGARVSRFKRTHETGFRVSVAEIERKLSERTRLIVLTNLHNPSGVLEDDATLRQVGELARRVGARVLIDEVYIETLFSPVPPTAFHLGNEFVVTSSLTKAFGLSGLRCGWILAEPELASRMWLLNDLFAATPVHVGECLSVVAFTRLESIGERARQILTRNRKLLNDFLDTRTDLQTVRPSSGTTMFPRWRAGNTDKLCELLRANYQTSVVPGRFFEMPEHFRIGIGGDSELLEQGLHRLGDALDASH